MLILLLFILFLVVVVVLLLLYSLQFFFHHGEIIHETLHVGQSQRDSLAVVVVDGYENRVYVGNGSKQRGVYPPGLLW